MTNDEFSLECLAFLKDLKDTDLYKETKELSDAISQDSSLSALAKERDDLYYQCTLEEDEEKRRKLQIEAKEKNDLFLQDERVKKYLQNYRDLKEILSLLNEQILKELNYD